MGAMSITIGGADYKPGAASKPKDEDEAEGEKPMEAGAEAKLEAFRALKKAINGGDEAEGVEALEAFLQACG